MYYSAKGRRAGAIADDLAGNGHCSSLLFLYVLINQVLYHRINNRLY